MSRFLITRLAQSAVVLTIMSFVIYCLIGLMPGDPIDIMISTDPNMTSAEADRLRALQGLDRPLLERYASWLGGALSGDFGTSRIHAKPVLDVLLPALSHTALLMGASFILALAIALPAGIYAALRPYSMADYSINLLAFAGISVPPFWLGLLLIIIFAVILGVLPAGGVGADGIGLMWQDLQYLVLPVVSLTIASIGSHTRFMRASMIDTLRQDYIRTAWAKGLDQKGVVFHHALRNAMLPVVTVIALDFGYLFSGALITETIFSYPGMGKLIFDSIMGNDFNLAMISLLFATMLTLLGNFMADVAYVWLDPRISFREVEK